MKLVWDATRWRTNTNTLTVEHLNPTKEGTQQGQVQRVSGYGMNGGDLFIKLFIKIPQILTKEQRSAIMKWKNTK